MEPANAPSPNTLANAPVAPPVKPAEEQLLASSLTSWPGAFAIYKYSSKAVKRNIWLMIGIWVIALVLTSICSIKQLGFAGTILGYLVQTVTVMATLRLLIAGVKGTKLQFAQVFDNAVMLSLKLLGLQLLVGIILVLSFLALIVPFFILFPRFTLADYYLIDKNMSIFDAIEASWRSTKGNVGKIWGILGVSLLMSLLMFTLIGIPVAIYLLIMYSAASVVLYQFVLKNQPSAEAAPSSPQPADNPPAPTPQATPPAPAI